MRFVVAGRAIDGFEAPRAPALTNGDASDVIAGYIGAARLARLHAEATVVACPYLDATQSGVVLTAYAFGTPVVASAVGGLPEYVDDGTTGVLVPPGDATSLAEAIIGVLTDTTTGFGWSMASRRFEPGGLAGRRSRVSSSIPHRAAGNGGGEPVDRRD